MHTRKSVSYTHLDVYKRQAEYGVSKASISIWVKQFREECQTNKEAKADYDYMKENLQLKKQLAELQKENDFLKKAAAFFAKEID